MLKVTTSVYVGHEPMTVKELAAALRVSCHFVYQMRSCGFVMDWSSEVRREAATLTQARYWLKRTKFKVVNGRGKVKR